jgi:hypothetical protein
VELVILGNAAENELASANPIASRSRIILLPCELHHVSEAFGQLSLAFMQNRSMFNHCCEMIGRASALIAFAGMGSLVLAATVVDVLR